MKKVRDYVEVAESLGQQKFNQQFEEDICEILSTETELLTENGRVLSIRWNEDGTYRYHSKYKNQ